MKPTTWKQWLACAKVTYDAADDLIEDARADRGMPDIHSQAALQSYLLSRNACQGALNATPEVWRRFQQWRKAQEPAARMRG